MKDPLKVTVEDIGEVISALKDKGIGVQITLLPIKKDEEPEKKKVIRKDDFYGCPNCGEKMMILQGDNFCSK